MKIELRPIGYVKAARAEPADDFWGNTEACIVLDNRFGAEALQGIEEFSHAEVIYLFHRVVEAKTAAGTRHPRNNAQWPAVGIFAQRARNRPNRLGTTICRVLRRDGPRLHVTELDAIDGTPVLDIKPVLSEFLPRSEVRQPRWSSEIMENYWAPYPPIPPEG